MGIWIFYLVSLLWLIVGFILTRNIIASSRDSWTMRQKELIDLSREHNKLLGLFPGSLVFSILGRKPIDITIVTSSKTEKAFETGKDDDTKVF